MNSDSGQPKISNRPGLPAIAYRVGDYRSFYQRMLSNLSKNLLGEGENPLKYLTTRDQADPAIALLDAWAVVVDVLTFYQERIANEGYLRTAIESRSIRELVRAIGYELNPGVAASVYLAFTVEDTPDGLPVAKVPQGTGLTSIPVADESPQVFETSEDLIARLEWNALKPRPAKSQQISIKISAADESEENSSLKISAADKPEENSSLLIDGYQIEQGKQENGYPAYLYLQGISTQLKPGDHIVLRDEETLDAPAYILRLETVEPIPPENYTQITWSEQLLIYNSQDTASAGIVTFQSPQILAFRQPASLFGHNAPNWRNFGNLVERGLLRQEWSDQLPTDNLNSWTPLLKLGLPNTDISCLAIANGYVFLGTAGNGIFRRTLDNSKTDWVPVNDGLSGLNVQSSLLSLNVHTLWVDSRGYLYAGTSGNAVFRSKNNGENWTPIPLQIPLNLPEQHTPLINTVVRSLVTQNNYLIAGTDDGIFRYEGTPLQWEEKRPELATYALHLTDAAVITREIISFSPPFDESGTTAQFILVQNLTDSLNEDDTVTINNQNTVIVGIWPPNFPFLGVTILKIRPAIANLQIGSIIFFRTASSKPHIFAGTEQGVYASDDQGETWHLKFPGDNAHPGSEVIYSLTAYEKNGEHYLFAGTRYGIYFAETLENDWTAKGLQGDDKTIVYALDVYEKANNGYVIFAGTNDGIHFSENDGDNWEPLNTDISAKYDVKALRMNQDTGILWAGTRLNQFNLFDDWPNFKIQEPNVDLDAIYTNILPNSWIVLLQEKQEDQEKQAKLLKAKAVSPEYRSDFGLNETVTRITTETLPGDLDDFELRETIILAQSVQLELAQKPLTVDIRKHQIFAEPLKEKQIFLSEFVAGLSVGKTLILSGKHIRAEIQQVGGIFLLNNGKQSWQRYNQGLLNQAVQVLDTHTETEKGEEKKYLLAGTQEGIFRRELSVDQTQWLPIDNENLSSSNIRALVMASVNNPSADQEYYYVVGTDLGVFFRQTTDSEWQQQEEEASSLKHQVNVLTKFKDEKHILAGTDKGLFQSSDGGQTWKLVGLTNVKVQAIATSLSHIFVGTADSGIFRASVSSSSSFSWQQVTAVKRLTGTITSEGRRIKGFGSNFIRELKASVQSGIEGFLPYLNLLEVGGQTKRIRRVLSDDLLELEDEFGGALPANTLSTANNGLTNLNVTALVLGDGNRLLAGTVGSGIFYSDDKGDTWQAAERQPKDLYIRCLVNHSQSPKVIFAGTESGGVFRSQDNGNSWESLSKGLTNTDVRAIVSLSEPELIIAGGTGILTSPDGWEQVELKPADLLYVLKPPKPLPPEQQPAGYQSWQVRDRHNFVGTLVTVSPNDLVLMPATEEDAQVSEVKIVETPPNDQEEPLLLFTESLQYSYDPMTVKIYANVVRATNGETVNQVLGSGNTLVANQQFPLTKLPLTYVAATTPSGVKSELEVRVNGILWQKVSSLYFSSQSDQHYTIQIEDNGETIVSFGDGQRGARLLSGQENVEAKYRQGLGLEGNVSAGSLTQLNDRPPGIEEVINPLPASGAADPETANTARVKAPPTVRTLDRIVSLKDFEDFAQGFTGIGKAQAMVLRNQRTQIVHITVAAVNGGAVEKSSSLYENLVKAIDGARDPFQVVVQVDSYEKLSFNLEARILINQKYQEAIVIGKIRQSLTDQFAFEQRQFGQAVTASEAIAIIQKVEGVVAVDLDSLYPLGTAKRLEQILSAEPARWDETQTTILPAQLLLLNPNGITLTPVSVL